MKKFCLHVHQKCLFFSQSKNYSVKKNYKNVRERYFARVFLHRVEKYLLEKLCQALNAFLIQQISILVGDFFYRFWLSGRSHFSSIKGN